MSLDSEGLIKVWEAATGKLVFTLRGLVDTGPGSGPFDGAPLLAWSADGKELLGALPGRKLVVWDAATGAELRTRAPIPSCHAFGPGGKRLAKTTGGKVQIWDTELGKQLTPLDTPEASPLLVGFPLPLAWAPDGQRLAKGGADGTVRAWQVSAVPELMRAIYTGSGAPPVWGRDNREIITTGPHGTIRAWDAGTGELRRTLGGAAREMTAVAWSHDGRRLATGNQVGRIDLWDTASGKRVLALEGHTGGISALSWGPGDRRLAALSAKEFIRGGQSWDGQLRAWDTATGRQVLSRDLPWGGPTARVALAWSPGGEWLATATTGGLGHVWDATTGAEVLVLKRSSAQERPETLATSWRADGRQLVTADRDGLVTVWDAAAGKEVSSQTGPLPQARAVPGEPALAWSPDGCRLALLTREGTFLAWDSASGKVTFRVQGPPLGPFSGIEVAWGAGGRRLATSFSNQRSAQDTVQVWDAASGKELFRRERVKRFEGGHAPAGRLAWATDGRRVAVALPEGIVEIWDGDKGQVLFHLRVASLPQNRAASQVLPDRLSWAPDGRRLAAIDSSGTVTIWDASSGDLALTLGTKPEPQLDSVAVVVSSPDGRQLASASASGAIRIWDTVTGKEMLSLAPSRAATAFGGVAASQVNRVMLAWSGDGSRLASSESVERTIQVWDTATGAKLSTLPEQPREVRSLAWSRDGRWLASAGDDGAVKVWDMARGKEAFSFPYVRPPSSLSVFPRPIAESLLAWSADSLQLAVAGGDGAVTIWDIITGKEVVKLFGTKAPAYSVAWAPDGRRLASVGGDGAVSLWEPVAGQQVFAMRASLSATVRAASLSWSPNGQRLALGIQEHVEADGTITVWDAPPVKE
jgi:WD40 repeat protein